MWHRMTVSSMSKISSSTSWGPKFLCKPIVDNTPQTYCGLFPPTWISLSNDMTVVGLFWRKKQECVHSTLMSSLQYNPVMPGNFIRRQRVGGSSCTLMTRRRSQNFSLWWYTKQSLENAENLTKVIGKGWAIVAPWTTSVILQVSRIQSLT